MPARRSKYIPPASKKPLELGRLRPTLTTATYVGALLVAGFIVSSLFIQVDAVGSSKKAFLQAPAPSAADPLVYVAEPDANSIAVVDTNSSAVVDTLSLGESYAHFVAVPSRGLLYASPFDTNSSTLYALSMPSLNVVATIQVGQGVHHLAATPDGGMVITSSMTGVVSEVNTTTNTVIRNIQLGGAPLDVAVASKYGAVIVANAVLDAVQEVNMTTGQVIRSTTGLGLPVKLSVSADQSYVVVTTKGSNYMDVLSLPDLAPQAELAFPSGPHMLYLDSARGYAYVGLENSSIAIVNLSDDRVVKAYSLPGQPEDIQAGPGGGTVFFTAGTDLDTINADTLALSHATDLGTILHGLIVVP